MLAVRSRTCLALPAPPPPTQGLTLHLGCEKTPDKVVDWLYTHHTHNNELRISGVG